MFIIAVQLKDCLYSEESDGTRVGRQVEQWDPDASVWESKSIALTVRCELTPCNKDIHSL